MAEGLRKQAALRDELMRQRLDTIVPALMRRHDIACWIVSGREYAEDPVLRTMLPSAWLSARRRTILVWFNDGSEHERAAVSRYDVGPAFRAGWHPEVQPNQWECLAQLIADRNPATIGVSISPDFAHGDGLTATEHDALAEALGPELSRRLISSQPLTVGWLETRLPQEYETYRKACEVAHEILRRGLSDDAITPGVTTTDDLVWWYRQTVRDAGLVSWFHPTVSVQRRGDDGTASFATRPGDTRVEPGDLVHVDFGIVWNDLCTDQQEHLYVLGPGESSPPDGLVDGLVAGLRQQDALLDAFAQGRTGNELLAVVRALAERRGDRATFYSHPIGYHGHGAGPTIGLWDEQTAVPGPGDHRIAANTAYSIELSVDVPVPEWDGQIVKIMLEQDAWFDGYTCEFLDGRQEALWVLG